MATACWNKVAVSQSADQHFISTGQHPRRRVEIASAVDSTVTYHCRPSAAASAIGRAEEMR